MRTFLKERYTDEAINIGSRQGQQTAKTADVNASGIRCGIKLKTRPLRPSD
jgi:hypothetical protein